MLKKLFYLFLMIQLFNPLIMAQDDEESVCLVLDENYSEGYNDNNNFDPKYELNITTEMVSRTSNKDKQVNIKEIHYGIIPNDVIEYYARNNMMDTIRPTDLHESVNVQNEFLLFRNVKKYTLNGHSIDPSDELRVYDPQQYPTVVLTVDPPVSGIPISWSITDPDDPATSTIIDPNGSSGNDNRGQISLYYNDNVTDAFGQARCTVYMPTLYGGDDVKVTATIDTQEQITTGRIVRWRYLITEYDYMENPSGPDFIAETENLNNIHYAFEGTNTSLTNIVPNWCTYITPGTSLSFQVFTHQQYTQYSTNPPSSPLSLQTMHNTYNTFSEPIHIMTIDDHTFSNNVQGIADNNSNGDLDWSYVYVGRLRNDNQTYREKWLLPHEIAHQLNQWHDNVSSQEGLNSGNISSISWPSNSCWVKGDGNDVRCQMFQSPALPLDAETRARFGEYHVRSLRGVTAIE